ncbi:MAG: hypothetical protein WBO32_06605 [Cyclobacteriaceae bacterium]
MGDSKKRVIKSLETLSEDLRDLIKKQHPNGFESSIYRIMNAKKEPIFVFPLETDDSLYLVKVPATKNSSGGYEVDSGERDDDDDDDGFDGDGYNSKGGDFDDDDDNSKDPSYDPDFDN